VADRTKRVRRSLREAKCEASHEQQPRRLDVSVIGLDLEAKISESVDDLLNYEDNDLRVMSGKLQF
jgi:hypothetical protein